MAASHPLNMDQILTNTTRTRYSASRNGSPHTDKPEDTPANLYTTERGHSVTFHSVAPLLDKLEAWRLANVPPVPTYTPETAPGVVPQAVEHHYREYEIQEQDENGKPVTVKKIDTSLETEDDWKAWRAYEMATAQVQADFGLRFMKVLLLRGVQTDAWQDDAWVIEQRFMGYEVPDEPMERRWHWLQTELATTKQEYEAIVIGVLRASGADEEVVSQMEVLFRGAMERARRTKLESTAPTNS